MSLISKLPFELFVGLRYLRAKRKSHFTTFISITSMVGIALGVAVLIVVLSVMNGFGTELRNRILGVASHLQITEGNNTLSNWQQVAAGYRWRAACAGGRAFCDGAGHAFVMIRLHKARWCAALCLQMK